MNILVTGGNGQLGNCLKRISKNSINNYIFTDIDELNIIDKASVENFINKEKIDLIINCAAYTNVDKAEEDYELAESLNSKGVKNLADAIKSRNGYLIHISTDYVFGGSSLNTPIKEEEKVNPTGVYGLTKLHGEEAVKNSGAHSIIIRTSWLYSEFGKNFLKTMLDLTSRRKDLKVVFDQCGTPTYAGDLADSIVRIIDDKNYKGNEGTYHFSNEGVTSWYDFAKTIAEISGNDKCEILPCHSDEFPSKVVRPSYSVLDKTKFKNTFEIEIPYWRDSLIKCMNNLRI